MSLWESLGFRSNPYDAKWLEVSEEGLKLFVGREEEGKYFQTILSSADGGLLMVEGDVGVGKTSFVNIQQYLSFKEKIGGISRLLPCFEPTGIFEPVNIYQTMISILSNCIYSLMQIYGEEKIKKDKELKEIYGLINQTIQNLPSIQVGVSVPSGIGATVGIGKSALQTSPLSIPLQTFVVALDNLVEITKEKYKFDGICVPLNNLDILSEETILTFFDQLRDILVNRKNFWWVFIGFKGLFSILETKRTRISEIFKGRPIVLPPLTWEELEEAIERRIKHFCIQPNVQLPVPKQLVKLLYEISKGEIRFIFKRLTDLIVEFKARYPSAKSVNYNEGLVTLRQLAMMKLNEIPFTRSDREIIMKMAKIEEFRPKDYAKFGLKSAQSLNKYIRKFTTRQLLHKSEVGKATVYRCSGDVKLVFGSM